MKRAIEALRPYGPIPVIIAVLGIAAMAALAAGANGWAVTGVFAIGVGATVLADLLRLRHLGFQKEGSFERKLRVDGKIPLQRLEDRLKRKRREQGEPSLFPENQDTK
jgi:hypothetical protein